MGAGPDPVSAAEFDRLIGRLGPFEPAPHLAVAVSGGRDSLTLGLLAHDWTVACNGRVTGLIVDHGLRRDSADEAAQSQYVLRRSGIAAVILKATGRPRRNLQAWARAVRYVLMTGWCRDAGVLHLLVAHQQDDQAETLLANITRNPGLRGVAAMAAVRELAACRIVRPLLDIPRDRLTATLRTRNVAWIDDPSNRDRRFRRVRLREQLAGRRERAVLAARAQASGQARRLFDRNLADILVGLATQVERSVLVDRKVLREAEPELVAAAIASLVRWSAGRPAPPRQLQLTRTVSWLCGPSQRGRRTVGGCIIHLDGASAGLAAESGRQKGDGERRAAPDPIALAPAGFQALPIASGTQR